MPLAVYSGLILLAGVFFWHWWRHREPKNGFGQSMKGIEHEADLVEIAYMAGCRRASNQPPVSDSELVSWYLAAKEDGLFRRCAACELEYIPGIADFGACDETCAAWLDQEHKGDNEEIRP